MDQVDNSISLEFSRFCALKPTAYIHYIASIWDRFYADVREVELESGYVTWWEINNFMLRGILESILEGAGEICNENGEVVGLSNVRNKPECRYFEDW